MEKTLSPCYFCYESSHCCCLCTQRISVFLSFILPLRVCVFYWKDLVHLALENDTYRQENKNNTLCKPVSDMSTLCRMYVAVASGPCSVAGPVWCLRLQCRVYVEVASGPCSEAGPVCRLRFVTEWSLVVLVCQLILGHLWPAHHTAHTKHPSHAASRMNQCIIHIYSIVFS